MSIASGPNLFIQSNSMGLNTPAQEKNCRVRLPGSKILTSIASLKANKLQRFIQLRKFFRRGGFFVSSYEQSLENTGGKY